ncbi:hypothetical protein ANCCEY_15604, partial [Ancylostoma ceylanicum]
LQLSTRSSWCTGFQRTRWTIRKGRLPRHQWSQWPRRPLREGRGQCRATVSKMPIGASRTTGTSWPQRTTRTSWNPRQKWNARHPRPCRATGTIGSSRTAGRARHARSTRRLWRRPERRTARTSRKSGTGWTSWKTRNTRSV